MVLAAPSVRIIRCCKNRFGAENFTFFMDKNTYFMFFYTFVPQKVGELAETLYLCKIYFVRSMDTDTGTTHFDISSDDSLYKMT